VVESVLVPDAPELLNVLSAQAPLLWRRRNDGMVGLGLLEKLCFSGKTRIADAGTTWHQIAENSQVIDHVNTAGSGLLAFGTFAFRSTSAVESVLLIPQLIVGQRAGTNWVTRIRFADVEEDVLTTVRALDLLAEQMTLSSSIAAEPSVHLTPGAQSESGFTSAVNQAIERIRLGELEKVVLARELEGTLAGSQDLRGPIRRLAESYPDCWTFSVDGLFGSSPETLVSVHDRKVTARVLAGTARRGNDTATDVSNAAELASSHKDLDEHGFATRSVVNALTPYSEQLTVSDAPFTLKLPNLWHLATDIAGSLAPGSTSLDLVAALHPTAAVAGTPTVTAVEVIDALEPFDRGRYAGPVGWIGADGDGEWAIALRCAQLSGATVTAYAGCGIVSDSIPETELIETEMKFRPIIDALS
jgi:menaquinone-specific isochorismate synthase